MFRLQVLASVAAALAVSSAAAQPLSPGAPAGPCPTDAPFYQRVFVPSNSSCVDFYLCSHGVAYKFTCPDGLYFNPGTDRCDYPRNVNCTESAPTTTSATPASTSAPTQVPTEITTGADQPTTEPNNASFPLFETLFLEEEYLESVKDICPDSDGNPFFFPNPSNCSTYYTCDHSEPVLMPCPAGLFFNNDTWTCDFPQNVDCVQPTDSPSDDEHGEQFLSVLSLQALESEADNVTSGGCPEQDGDFPVLLPNPSNCSTFFECSHGVPYLHVCPDHLQFNNNTWTCDFQYNVHCVDTA